MLPLKAYLAALSKRVPLRDARVVIIFFFSCNHSNVFAAVKRFVHNSCALTAAVYAVITAIDDNMIPLYSDRIETSAPNPFTVMLPVVIIYFITGSSFSPNSTRTFLNFSFALSNPA